MAAFFIVNLSIINAEKYQQYSAQVAETMIAFGGKPVLRGKACGVLAGTNDHQAVGVVEFPDLDSIDAWYNSTAYQALIPLRTEAADVVITKYQTAG